jgi:hypothetical protein
MPTHESLREETCGDTTGLVVRWQIGLEARPRYGLCKLRLKVAPSEPQAKDGRRIYGHPILSKPIDSSELIEIVEQNPPRCADVY